MEIITLIENQLDRKDVGLKPEHGISLLIRHGSLKILFDTGSSDRFLHNSRALGLDLEEVDLAVVSHGHFDHGGGLENFINKNARAKIYLHKLAWGDYYARVGGGLINKYIGLDKSLPGKYPGRFKEIDQATEIKPDVWLLTVVGKAHPRPRGNRMLHEKKAHGYIPDAFAHEILLAFIVKDSIILFTGCSHSSILNMVETIEKHFPDKRIKVIIGGFHMSYPVWGTRCEPYQQVVQVAETLARRPGLHKIFTGHCTGAQAFRILKGIMGEKLDVFSTGKKIWLP